MLLPWSEIATAPYRNWARLRSLVSQDDKRNSKCAVWIDGISIILYIS